MNEKIKTILFLVIASGIMYISGFFIGKHTRIRNIESELKTTIERLQSELSDRIRETEQLQQQLSGVKSDISIAIGLSEQSRQYCESINATVSDITVTSGNIAELLRQLDSNQRAIKQYSQELLSENTRLREQLIAIQNSITE